MTIHITASATAHLRTNLSIHHLFATAMFAGECERLEKGWKPPIEEQLFFRHSAFAASAVITAVCALEAYLNELHLDARDGDASKLGKLLDHTSAVAQLWDTVERQSIMRKYEWYTTLAHVKALDRGAPAYQAVSDLIALRDALVHYKPEWSHSSARSDRLEKRLDGKFELNPMARPGQLFIPYRCLGAGCARWALKGIFAFIGLFSGALQAENSWQPYRDRLNASLLSAAV